jgi:integrase
VSSRGSPQYDPQAHAGSFRPGDQSALFRDAAATTLAIADPAHVRVAAPLLGHRTFTTTERHYQQAQAFDAHRAYIDALFSKAKRP